ncbi:MAG TPA: ribonuclease III [Anaeromyxobacteraceae bacterium]|nr:ribonuclease III [Anaeromyxobacteraceae bacterium]
MAGERDLPAAPPPDPVAALEVRLGLAFRDRARALAALTHKSWVNEHRDDGGGDNERLEFLGDAVVDLLVSHRLMERFPAAREGDLSKMRAAVVDEAGLAAMARALRLGELLRLGRGEEMSGGREKASLLADAMEAVIAAVWLEHGVGEALALVDRFLEEAFARAAAGTLDRDWKTQLQEWAQARLRATPRYRVAAELGPDHAKVFEIELELGGEALGRGSGRSKKEAEQAAAQVALTSLLARQAAGAMAVGEHEVARVAPAPRASGDELALAPRDAEAADTPAPRRRVVRTGRAARGAGGHRGAAPRRSAAARAGRGSRGATGKKKVAARRRRR